MDLREVSSAKKAGVYCTARAHAHRGMALSLITIIQHGILLSLVSPSASRSCTPLASMGN